MKTFKEIKKLVGTTEGRLPSAKSLQDRKDVVVHEVRGGTEATVFSTGHILYTREERSTVYTVDRCKEMKSDFYGEMDAETAESYRQQGLVVKGGCLYLPESVYEELPWFEVISMICEERLDHNEESRQDYYTDFSLDNDGNDWDEHTWVEDLLTQMIAEEDAKEAAEQNERDLARLREVKKEISPRQLEIVEYKFAHMGLSEKKIGEHFGISQQAAHKSYAAGMKNLAKKF